MLKNGELSGVIAGLTLATRPEEIYRALIEGTAFGACVIIGHLGEHGLPVREIVCGGGLHDIFGRGPNPVLSRLAGRRRAPAR